MSDTLIDIVAVSGRPAGRRWQAVAPRGSVAGVADLRPIPFEPDLLLPARSVTRLDGAEISLRVAPRWRRRGIGSRLLAAVRDQAGEARLVAEVATGSAGEAFCRRHGFQHTGSRRYDLLTYCDVHQAWLGELVDAEPAGYRLTHWTGDLPQLPRVEELLTTPSGSGNALLTAADAGGELAAYVLAVVGGLATPRARQYGPAALAEHRGMRLERWVNAALIQRLRAVHPHVAEIEAAAVDDDPYLLAVRAQLGFQLLRRTSRYELVLR